jgi:hypothetical protein
MEEAPIKPDDPDRMDEFPGKRMITAGDWYKHEVECLALSKAICQIEGRLVTGLVRRMWKESLTSADMMKFLFKQYTHVHGLSEPRLGLEFNASAGDNPGLTLYMPHNGREEPAVPMRVRAPAKAPTKAKRK